MFIEIEKKRTEFPFGEAKLWFRFDNRAFLNIEKSGLCPFDTRDISENAAKARVFISEGLSDCLKTLGANERKDEITNALMSGGSESVTTLIQHAVLEALPLSALNGNTEKSENKANAGTMLSLYCDIMHRPEEEFWSATLREITERWERYAVIKGYRKAPIQIRRYDD
mgnify:FL=1